MRAGQLRHTVSIQKLTAVRGRMGGATSDWVAVATDVAAAIEPLNGRELYTAQQNNSEVTVRIKIRYRDGIESAHRVVHRGVVYSVLYVINPQMRNTELQLMCSTGVNEG